MQNSKTQTHEFPPNFITEQSKTAEIGLAGLVERGRVLGVSTTPIELKPNEIVEILETYNKKRITKVRKGLAKEGLEIEELSKNTLFDRLLGIDGLLELEGKRFGIDVTTGKGTALNNKKIKASELHPIYRKLGIDHFIVLRLKQEITDDLVLDFFGKLENIAQNDSGQPFVHTIKYGREK